MQLVRVASAWSAARSEVCRWRALLHAEGRLKAAVIGTGVWAVATAATAAIFGSGLLGFKGLACEHPGEIFPTLYDTLSLHDLWWNTPWSFTAAVVCITLSMRWAQYTELRVVKAVAYCSLPCQAWWWHGTLMLTECG
jgi:hypothetical protein